MFELQLHGPDTYVGTGPRYPWGGLYGGQIVAQALRAAAASVDDGLAVHSLRAYFIRRGDHAEPVRYEVDRIRNGRSFCTRRVVARQAVGAILNLEASFQIEESSPAVTVVDAPVVPGPEELEPISWMDAFVRCDVPDEAAASAVDAPRAGGGRTVAWLRTAAELGDPADVAAQLLHRCWLAYMSDDLPFDAVRAIHPHRVDPEFQERSYGASLDHTMWFHRPLRADRWHLHDITCHAFGGARGLTLAHVFDDGGDHVATYAQEILLRDPGPAR